MSDGLLAAYAVGGGTPPATYEVLRIQDDGLARAVVGNAWPFGSPQDEAGSYEHRIDDAERAALEQAMAAVGEVPEPAAPRAADAGRCELRLADGREFRWPTTASPPPSAAPLVELLRDLLSSVRRHPRGTLTLTLDPPATAAVDQAFDLGLALRNTGNEHVALVSPGAFRLRMAAVGPGFDGGRPDLEGLVAAPLLSADPPAELAPGERCDVACQAVIGAPGTWRLDALARLDADVPYEDGRRLPLECTLLAGPAVVRVGCG